MQQHLKSETSIFLLQEDALNRVRMLLKDTWQRRHVKRLLGR